MSLPDFIKILLFSGWERKPSKVLECDFYTMDNTTWLIEDESDISEENRLHALWQAAAKCLELAKPKPATLLHPWMPVAMALQALDVEKLQDAITNFIEVYEYYNQRESEGAKADSEGVAAIDQDLPEADEGKGLYIAE